MARALTTVDELVITYSDRTNNRRNPYLPNFFDKIIPRFSMLINLTYREHRLEDGSVDREPIPQSLLYLRAGTSHLTRLAVQINFNTRWVC